MRVDSGFALSDIPGLWNSEVPKFRNSETP